MKLRAPKTVIEPFRIKAVEPMPLLEHDERVRLIEDFGFNLFAISADAVTFDLLTDSGTSAMSANQWAAMMVGDESYAGARSFDRFESTVKKLTGKKYVIPTHQGRSAEALLMRALIKEGQTVIGNTHFDTTRANIEAVGAIALDLPAKSNQIENNVDLFKGNIDLEALEEELKSNRNVGAIILTITNNSVGGQPVSVENITKTQSLAKKHGIPLYLDAARFAENAYFIKTREPSFSEVSIQSIAQKVFSLSDGVLMSAKKDAFGNIGGFLALNDPSLAQQIRNIMILVEGFPTYGGLAGRDLEALSVGLHEILDEAYLAYRIRSVEYFGNGIESVGFEVVKPFGGHAVYVDAGKSLPHIPNLCFPGQALSVALYESIGIRSVEVGSVMLGQRDPKTGQETPAPRELLRLALPRRVYTQSHVDYMIEMMGELHPHIEKIGGMRITYQADFLRHFTARFEKIE